MYTIDQRLAKKNQKKLKTIHDSYIQLYCAIIPQKQV